MDKSHKYQDFETNTDAQSNFSRKSKSAAVKEQYHTSVNFVIMGNIVVYTNFFFIKKVLKLVGNLNKDMASKRSKLLKKVDSAETLENIKSGYSYLQDMKQKALEHMEELRQEDLLK